jgi:GH25 family lysozyme M1 (1,4-beta-N-acetylmuramidase)
VTIAGVDLSSFQGSPRNWQPIAGNIAYAAVKLTEYSAGARRYTNPFAAPDWMALKAAGLGRIAYMFGHPSAPYKASAGYFLAVLDTLGFTDGDMVALDHEVSDGLSPANCSEWAQAVMGELEHQTARPPLLYTFLSFADEGHCAGLGKYPLWIADPSSPPGKPRVPRPWTGWAIHQHSIKAPIDRDVAAFTSLTQMRAALGRGGSPAPNPAPGWEAAMLATLPVLKQGADDAHLPHWYVRRIQLILGGVFGHHVTADGAYGTQTAAAVRAVQAEAKITADGICGPQTWALLLTGSPG